MGQIGRYIIERKLGAGGMGEVYKAHDTRLDRTVALKVLPPDLAIDPGWLTRFKQEARAVAALNHSNICALHDIGEAPIALPASRHPDSGDHSGPVTVTFLVIEYLDGASLSARLERGPLPIDQAVDVGLQIAQGLAAAHARRIVHRDVATLSNGAAMVRERLAEDPVLQERATTLEQRLQIPITQ